MMICFFFFNASKRALPEHAINVELQFGAMSPCCMRIVSWSVLLTTIPPKSSVPLNDSINRDLAKSLPNVK